MAWKNHRLFKVFSFGIDRYAQCCLMERPERTWVVDVEPETAKRLLGLARWVIVGASQVADAGYSSMPLGDGTVQVMTCPLDKEVTEMIGGPKDQKAVLVTRMRRDDAHEVILQLASQGVAILASSMGYHYGRADFEDGPVLRDVPHAVIAVTDQQSLWMKLGFLQQEGLAGSRMVLAIRIQSPRFPDSFSYQLLKPPAGAPIIVHPCLSRFAKRAITVVDQVPSPYGVDIRSIPENASAFARHCLPAVEAAIERFEANFEPTKEVWEALERAGEPVLSQPSAAERLRQVAARD